MESTPGEREGGEGRGERADSEARREIDDSTTLDTKRNPLCELNAREARHEVSE